MSQIVITAPKDIAVQFITGDEQILTQDLNIAEVVAIASKKKVDKKVDTDDLKMASIVVPKQGKGKKVFAQDKKYTKILPKIEPMTLRKPKKIIGRPKEETDVTKDVEIVVGGGPPFVCLVCNKEFKALSYLKRHAIIHSSAACVCKICGHRCSRKVNLEEHMRIHTGEMGYVCQDCGRSFRHGGAFRTHRFLHTGERPYECDVCGNKFRQPTALKKHKKKHLKEAKVEQTVEVHTVTVHMDDFDLQQ